MRKLLLMFITLLLAATVWLQLVTRDTLHSEQINENLKITTITVDNAKIYLVDRNNKRIMIDSGNPGDEHKIEAFMHEAGIEPASINYLILTHGHLDHVGTAAYFQKQYGITVIAGRGDETMLSRGEQQPLCPTSWLATLIDLSLQGKKYPLLEADILLDRPYKLDVLGIEGDILPMPGHTLGTLLVSFDNIVFVGDLIRGELLRQSVPNRHFFMCDIEDNDRDIQALLAMTGYTRWYPGHFGPLKAADVGNYWQ